MKGFVHFMSGLAVATCFPQAVEIAQRDNSFILAWGGIFGILPDTLDFKFAQFWEKYDFIVDPDPDHPDPQQIANTVAEAIERAYDTQKSCSMMFMTIKKGADLWREYRICFDVEQQKIIVRIGPLVNTSKKAYPGTEISGINEGIASLKCRISQAMYEKETSVDIMNGPSFCFVPQKDGEVKMEFIPWHRRWSHSLVLGIVLGIAGWLLLGLWWGFDKTGIYGMVFAAAYCIHVLEDQLGYLGNNLFWPFFTNNRIPGLQLMHSGDAWPNFITVWLALALIFYNLNHFSPEPILSISPVVYFAYAVIVPLFFMRSMERFLTYFEKAPK